MPPRFELIIPSNDSTQQQAQATAHAFEQDHGADHHALDALCSIASGKTEIYTQ